MNTDLIILIVLCVVLALGAIILLYFALKNKWLNKLKPTIEKAMKEAEASGKSGAEKKKYVMEHVYSKCEELKIPYKLIISVASKLIELIVKYYNVLSKN